MLKNAVFFCEKLEKLPQRWGLRPPNPHWPPAAEPPLGSAPRPPPNLLLAINLRVTFEHCSDFSASLKSRPIISYLIDRWAPLVKLAPLAQTSSYATDHIKLFSPASTMFNSIQICNPEKLCSTVSSVANSFQPYKKLCSLVSTVFSSIQPWKTGKLSPSVPNVANSFQLHLSMHNCVQLYQRVQQHPNMSNHEKL